MRATRTLPANYRKVGTLDLSKNDKLLLLLNLIGIVGLAFSGWLFLMILTWLRPSVLASVFRFEFHSLVELATLIGVVLVLTVFHIILHEAIHGFFFWLFTRSRPLFAFRWVYAYAAAPEWYIPRNEYLIIAIAPLALISLAGIIVFAVAPVTWLLPTWFVLIMNAGGAVGDIAAVAWLMRQPQTCLAQDRGDAVTLFVPEK